MKKLYQRMALIFMIGTVIFGVSACSTKEKIEDQEIITVQDEKESGDKVQIGFTVDSFVIERWIRDRDAFVTTARELGAEVNIQDAGGEAEEQIRQIEYFIKKRMDVIVIVARDCNALGEVIKKAKDAGIKIVSYDRLIQNVDSDLYISFDNEAVGTLMAKMMAQAIPEGGPIFMIQGAPEDNNTKMVRKGFDDVLKETNLQIVYEAWCEGWIAEYAIPYVEEALEQYPDVKGIMCGNDDVASQVIKVLAEKQLAGKIVVVGQDGNLAACQRILEGIQTMTVFKAIEELAREAAQYVVRLGKGEELEEITGTMNDGTYNVPCVLLSPIAVTKENMDEVMIDSGFYYREDVYLNAE